jgi:DNA-binding transcriptional LysR family regulator
VNQGVGWSILSGICLGRFQGTAEPIRFKDGQDFSRKTHILYRSDYFALPQVQAFVEVAKRHEPS